MTEQIKSSSFPVKGLLWTQFFSALTENGWKMMVFTLITRSASSLFPHGHWGTTAQSKGIFANLIFLVTILLSSVLFFPLFDRWSKKQLIVASKFGELGVFVLAALALFWMPGNSLVLFSFLIGLGLIVTLFNPSKQGILPEVLPFERLAQGNGLMELCANAGMMCGTALGPLFLFADQGGAAPEWSWLAPVWLFILVALGLLGMRSVPTGQKVPSSGMRFTTAVRESYECLRKSRTLVYLMMACFAFWFVYNFVFQSALVYTKMVISSEKMQGIPLTGFSVGLALGAFTTGLQSKHALNKKRILVALLVILACVASITLGLPSFWKLTALLFSFGFAMAMLLIPLFALLQGLAPPHRRGALLSLANFMNVVGMIASGLTIGLISLFDLGMQATLYFALLFTLGGSLGCIYVLHRPPVTELALESIPS